VPEYDGCGDGVTYNFDAERWFEMHRARLAAQRAAGELDDAALAAALDRLDRDYEAMLDRLDGTFQIGPLAPPAKT
jgi:hypothetical protein